MTRTEYRFPIACSQCGAVQSMPFKAETMANGSICISLRCGSCRHESTLELAPDEVAVAAKADRRGPNRAL